MTKRFYPRYIDRQDGTDLYVVIDSDTGEEVSARISYHEANDVAGRRNKDVVSARHAAWEVALGYEPTPAAVRFYHFLSDKAHAAIVDAIVHGSGAVTFFQEVSGIRVRTLSADEFYRWKP